MSTRNRKSYVKLSGDTGYYEEDDTSTVENTNTSPQPKRKHLLFGTERTRKSQDSRFFIKGYN